MKWFPHRPKVRHIRLHTEPGSAEDRYVQLPLTEHFDYLDVLSLQLSQKDLYQLRQANYGVVAGRVVANEGVGVPNCRVSVFIPAPASTDDENPDEVLLRQRYPWQKVSADDVDANGRRYNLLPAQPSFHGYNGFPYNDLGIGATPVTPLGSFPEREGVLTDPVERAVYDRYYRYTTVTNESGDFVLMGVPVGSHTLHLDADLTDLGRWSYSPVMLRQTLGYPESQFEENGKRIKQTTDLDSLSHLINLNAQVTVRPLWAQQGEAGGTTGELLGITRQDFRFPAPLRPHFTLASSIFSMGRNRWWGDNLHFRLHFGLRNLCIRTSDWVIGGGCDFAINFCVRLNYRILGRPHIGNCDNAPDDDFNFGFGFRVPNIIPFFRFEFRDDYCRLNGGKYDSSPFDIINHGATCECDVDAALEHVPDDGLTAALQLSSHRPELADIRLFTVTNNVTDEQARRWVAFLDAGSDQISSPDWASFNPQTDVQRLPKTEYLELNEDGQFILQPFCNRRPMITREDGLLVDSPDPRKGVMTEFRGYLYVKGTHELDAPSTNDTSGRIALKIPQSFDYAYSFGGDGNPVAVNRTNQWIFNHGLFKAGGLYSLAQRIATRRATLSDQDEQLNDLGILSQAFHPDPDGSVYKKGWDIQTGLITYTDRPAGRVFVNNGTYTPEVTTPGNDSFPANDTTYLGHETNFSRSISNVAPASTVPPLVIGSRNHEDFDATAYPPGLNQGIVVNPPAATSFTQGLQLVVTWSTPTPVPGNQVSIELVVIGDANPTSATNLLWGTDLTQVVSIDTNARYNPILPTYSWTVFLLPKPRFVRVNQVNVTTTGVSFTFNCYLLLRSLDDPAGVLGTSSTFTITIP